MQARSRTHQVRRFRHFLLGQENKGHLDGVLLFLGHLHLVLLREALLTGLVQGLGFECML